MRKTLAIELKDLPLRSRQLNPDELEDVFGGCSPSGGACAYPSDCCSNQCAFFGVVEVLPGLKLPSFFVCVGS